MQPRRFVFVLLVVASLLVNSALAVPVRAFPHWSSLLYCGVSFGQLAMLGVWLGFGHGLLMLRVSAILAASALAAANIAPISRPEFAQLFCFCTTISCLVACPLSIIRMTGWTIGYASTQSHADRLLGRWQFTMHGLLVWMTVTAITLGALRWMQFPWQHAWLVALYCLAMAAAGWAVLWTVFGAASASVRLLGTLLTLLLVCGSLTVLGNTGEQYREASQVSIICAVAFLTGTATAAALQSGGFSLIARLACQNQRFTVFHHAEGEH